MPDKAWKAWERRIAAWLKAERNPLSGSMGGRGTRADVVHPLIYPEAKQGKQVNGMSITHLWNETVRKARKEGKVPMVALQPKGSKDPMIVLPAEVACKVLALLATIPKERGGLLC